MPDGVDGGFLAGLFKAYLDETGCVLRIEKHKGERESDFWRYGRIVVEGPNAVGIRSFLCDCMVRYGDGDEDGMICEMLRRAFGGGEPMVHYFKEIGLGGIRSLEELALRLAATVPAGSRI